MEQENIEDERRLYYVGMTRARQSLALFCRADGGGPFALELDGDFLLDRRPEPPPPGLEATLKRYTLLSLRDLDLGFAGALPQNAPLHQALAELRVGSPLRLAARHNRIDILTSDGLRVGRLSRAGADSWLPRLNTVTEARVAAVILRRREDSPAEFKSRCRTERWEVPVPEFITPSRCCS